MLAHLDRAVAAYAAARQAPTAPAPAPGGEEVPVADGDAVAAGKGDAAEGAGDAAELARYGFRSLEDVRARVCLYKARHFLFTRNLKVPPPPPSLLARRMRRPHLRRRRARWRLTQM